MLTTDGQTDCFLVDYSHRFAAPSRCKRTLVRIWLVGSYTPHSGHYGRSGGCPEQTLLLDDLAGEVWDLAAVLRQSAERQFLSGADFRNQLGGVAK